MAIKIIADSASDIPHSIAEAHGIEVLPLMVYIDDVEYRDNVDLTSDELYVRMQAGASVKTSQIPLGVFMEAFERMAQTEDEYIYIAFSSNLSGTYQTAVLAHEDILAKYPNAKITIIDTKCASIGVALIVVEAAKMAESGATHDEIVAYVNGAKTSMEHVFSVDDLEYLFRGGRVNRTQATLGNILNIKPVLNVQDGFLMPIDKVKGKKRRLQKMLDYVETHGKYLDRQCIGIAHTVNEEEAAFVKSYFETAYGTREFIVGQLGCTIGAHCGPGVIAIFFRSSL
ncbi:DegV family protein [Fusibacter paucivorans]|uniref:DegV family protein n=1 Tax=Fusibacter paucivorans TaxID=76009 RepID=A0ABS5PRG4_9FIRM|nr:DegV family protein [Fusibacter paucivorans]MBS7527176.1 DegV family protein [Fusibacter paucivorans]